MGYPKFIVSNQKEEFINIQKDYTDNGKAGFDTN